MRRSQPRKLLTVEGLAAGDLECRVTGVGYAPAGSLERDGRPLVAAEHPRLFRLLRAGCLATEASLSQRTDDGEGWEWSGDPTDVALLSLGLKAGCDAVMLREAHRTLAILPFEPERRYAASIHAHEAGSLACVKGAPERVIAMCSRELADGGVEKPLDAQRALQDVDEWMRRGYRVLALADVEREKTVEEGVPAPEPSDLVFLGLVAMTDPPAAWRARRARALPTGRDSRGHGDRRRCERRPRPASGRSRSRDGPLGHRRGQRGLRSSSSPTTTS